MAESCLLYYITDRSAFPGDEPARRRRLLGKISEAARAGVDYIQLREKDLSTRALESLAREAIGVLSEASQSATVHRQVGTALLINHRTDVALAVGATGVHLRSDDTSPQEVRKIWSCGAGTRARPISPRDPLIGASCHSPGEVVQAQAATFAVFGPVFEKNDAHATGLALLQEACQARIPVLALGGITLRNAHSCLEAGAAGIAAIRLFQENDIAEIVKHLRS
jgi:thiamine-phosphate pyrophosphorylase